MAETPDFEKIARSMITTIEGDDEGHRLAIDGATAEIAEQLRLMWNARGAADIAKIETALLEDGDNSQMGNIDRALRSLDR